MKTILFKNVYAAVAALFIAMFAMPTTMQAQNDYELEIAGKKVTAANCNDLSVINGVSGTVKYDPTTKTLMLQNATINSEDNNAILTKVDGLTIKVIGTNNLTAKVSPIRVIKPLTITGGGTLNAESQKNCAIFVKGANLTIDNCTVNGKSAVYGIAGNDGMNENLTIKNATVTAEGTEKGSIVDFATLTLIDCKIAQPTDAKFDPSMHSVALNGEKVKSKVMITKVSTGIDTPITDTKTIQGIYTLSGVRLSGELKDLPKGIYIVNGKKIVKQ